MLHSNPTSTEKCAISELQMWDILTLRVRNKLRIIVVMLNIAESLTFVRGLRQSILTSSHDLGNIPVALHAVSFAQSAQQNQPALMLDSLKIDQLASRFCAYQSNGKAHSDSAELPKEEQHQSV
jgi:hypothetical protein